jgi:Domain of unknown function (DUF4404)
MHAGAGVRMTARLLTASGEFPVTTLQAQLRSLHGELARTRSVDPETRELLIALLTDITRLLGKPGTETDQSVIERLDELAVQFEAEHPALGNAIRQVVDALSKAGI